MRISLRSNGILQRKCPLYIGQFDQFGYHRAKVATLGFQQTSLLWLTCHPAHLAAIGQALAKHSEVAFAAATSGQSDIVAAVICRNADHLYDYITAVLAPIAGITHIETSPVLRQIKHVSTDGLTWPGEPSQASAPRSRKSSGSRPARPGR